MALTGFPSAIQVTLGSKWNGAVHAQLVEDYVMVLNKVSGQDRWTECKDFEALGRSFWRAVGERSSSLSRDCWCW